MYCIVLCNNTNLSQCAVTLFLCFDMSSPICIFKCGNNDKKLICGGEKQNRKDQLRILVVIRTIHMHDNLIKVCGQRGDSHAEEVSSRITGAITNLYAADARYHQTCLTTFVSSRNISAAVESTSKQQTPDPVNLALSSLLYMMFTLNH